MIVIILDNDNDIQKFNEKTDSKITESCIAFLQFGEWQTRELEALKFYESLGYIPVCLA